MKKADHRYITVEFTQETIKPNETIKTDLHTTLILDPDTHMTDILAFENNVRKIWRRAIKAIKAVEAFEMHIDDALYAVDPADPEDPNGPKTFSQIRFDAWKAAATWDQDPDGGYIYFNPDTRYTDEYRDMMLGKDCIKDLYEALN